MPLIPQSMQVLVQTKAVSQLLAGNKFPSIVAAVCSATCQYVLASSIVNSSNIVLGPGVGTQVGNIVGLVPLTMSTAMSLKAASQGIAGKDFKKMCDAISFGVVNSVMTTVVVQGTVIGGGPGTGFGKITGLIPSVLSAAILAQEAFRLIGGSKLPSIVSAIAFGICTHIMTFGVVNITCIGAAAPPPVGPIPIPAAPGIGRLY